MPWFQPTSTPPMASFYAHRSSSLTTNDDDDDEGEFEFGKDNHQRRQNNLRRRHENSSPSLLQDPLSRRLMSLMHPLSGPDFSAPTTIGNHGGLGSGGSGGASGSLPGFPPVSHFWHAFAGTSSNSSGHELQYPHPSYGIRQRELESEAEMQMQMGELRTDANVETYGFDEHAHFFYPRRITADEPFVAAHGQSTHTSSSTHGHYDSHWQGSQNESQYLGRNHTSSHGRSTMRHDSGFNVNDNEDQWNQTQHQHRYHHHPRQRHQHNTGTTQEHTHTHHTTNHYHRPSNNQDNGVHQRYGYDYPEETPAQQREKRKKQRHIVVQQQQQQQDSTDDGGGSRRTTFGISSSVSTKNTEQQQSWAQVGQIASYQNRHEQEQQQAEREKRTSVASRDKGNDPSTNSKRSKKKKKKKKRKKKDGERDDNDNDVQDIRTMLGGRNRKDEEQEDENDDDFQKKAPPCRKKWSKAKGIKKLKRPRSGSMDSNSNASPSKPFEPLSLEAMQLFAETYEVKNAGSSPEALEAFLQLLRQQKYVSWTMVFHDDMCSTPFLPSTKKYCTPKGKPCTMWNCTCENQIRAMQASKPLVGCMFVFPMNNGDDDEDGNDDPDNRDTSGDGGDNTQTSSSLSSPELDCFLLPLCPTVDAEEGPKDIDPGYERMANFPFLPISCDTTLKQRWETFRSILLDRYVVKVTFNVAVGLMPYHYHCAYDIPIDTSHEHDETGRSNGKNTATGHLDLVLPNMWDLRLASWILSPHADEQMLEMKDKKEGFAHLYPQRTCAIPDNATKQVIGLVEAKEQLEFLYILYPIVDKLLETKGLKHAFYEIESPAQSVLSSMECFGIGFKAERLLRIQKNIEEKIEALNVEAKEISNDCDFMLSSPQQVSKLLFDRMGLKVPELPGKQRNTNSQQQKSTSEESLKAMQKDIKARDGKGLRLIDLVLEFRGLNKVLSTYIRPYPKLARDSANSIHFRRARTRSKKKSGANNNDAMKVQKIHPMWMQTAVRTGRLSCRKPNLQQVPNGRVLGVCPRNAFTSSTRDSCLFACDYSQNEVRILAHMSNDEALIELFTKPGTTDIYKQMSSIISGKNADEITEKERAVAKQVTLAIMYGMGINSVAKKLDVNKSTAQAFFTSFYGRFHGVKQWMEQTIAFVRTHKYVTTITGRRRYLDNITSGDRALKSQAERQAINTVIQGSAADLMKLAMLKMASRISDWRKEVTNYGSSAPPKMLLQIHDELLFEMAANESDVHMLKAVVTRCCTEECVEELRLKVPLKLKCSVGTAWGSMKEI